ncbi:MAG: serine/threonine-protein kinase [Verrucomicrobiaceae bacterium]
MLDPFLQQSQENVQPALSVLNAGQKVFGGRFVLQRCLGQGGMGQVWLAQDTTLDQPRALKFVLPALVFDASARKRLRHEARLGTELAHPCIVRVFDFLEEGGGSPHAAVVMEYVDGRTLSDLLAEQENNFFEPEQIEKWIHDVISGLDYAHKDRQRFHLDLKPGNIIVETATNRAKLLDFGISRSAKDTLTRLTGQASSGTLPYMSPQQLNGESPRAADDVYSLGATVFELLTGTPPFFRGKLDDQIRDREPDTLMERRRQNVREGLSAAVGNDIPPSWQQWASCALSKSAESRVLSAPGIVAAKSKPLQPAVEADVQSTDEEPVPIFSAFRKCIFWWWALAFVYGGFGVIMAASATTSSYASDDRTTGMWFMVNAGVLVAGTIATWVRLIDFRFLSYIAVLGQIVIWVAMTQSKIGDAIIVIPVNILICVVFLVAGILSHRKTRVAGHAS